MSDVARVLEVLRDASIRGEDLAAALRGCGLPGADRAGDRLAAGTTLTEAVAGRSAAAPIADPSLAAAIPPAGHLAHSDRAWRDAERRRLMADHLAYPLACVLLLAVMAIVLAHILPHGPWYAPVLSAGWSVPPAVLAMLMVAAPWLPRAWRIPGSGWAAHLDRAGRWARAALAVHWRLTDAQAVTLLGTDLGSPRCSGPPMPSVTVACWPIGMRGQRGADSS